MKHDKWKVFFPAVVTMMSLHLMSVGLGNIFPLLFSRNAIVYFSVFLFLFFGVMMIYEAYHIQPKKAEEKLMELREQLVVQEKVEAKEKALDCSSTDATPIKARNKAVSSPESAHSGHQINVNQLQCVEETNEEDSKGYCKNPYMQLVLLLFLADWGDRCQISAIVLTATYNVWGVAAGGALVTLQIYSLKLGNGYLRHFGRFRRSLIGKFTRRKEDNLHCRRAFHCFRL
jgi:putative Ca2+/H+ antiporter (TMEM165/GDT1 family)